VQPRIEQSGAFHRVQSSPNFLTKSGLYVGPVPLGLFAQLLEDHLAVFLEYAQALFESVEKRLRRRRRLAALCDTFEVFPLVIDLRL